MLRHKLFHRAKKVPVSEQELKAKMKKKDKKSEKDEKKKKEEETAESSHAEGRETEEKKQGMVIVWSSVCSCGMSVIRHSKQAAVLFKAENSFLK